MAFGKKIRAHASLNKIQTNYISVESLINVLYEKNTILAMFSFNMCQEAVRRETTEGSLSDIRFHSTGKMVVIPKASINKSVLGFFDMLIGYQNIHI